VLSKRRRAIGGSVVLLGAVVFVFAAVGRHPPLSAPTTTLPFVGEFDLSVFHWMDDIRNGVLTLLARFLNVLGGGTVTTPFRIIEAVVLLVRPRWPAVATWLNTRAPAGEISRDGEAGGGLRLSGTGDVGHRGGESLD